jgi:phosphoserine phosphatase RsbU/P
VPASTGSTGTAESLLRQVREALDRDPAHLRLEEILDQTLEQVRQIMDVDTAAVLLLDPAGESLRATAAIGLEEEVRHGVRLPLNRGFAGKVAADARPMVLDRVDRTTVLNPILTEKGINSLLGVPLMVEGEVIGVIHVGTLRPRAFSPDDVALLELVADTIALTAKGKLDEEVRAAASTLQLSLLPGVVPTIEGLDIAARYAPGEGGVGGDWYDVFALPDGGLGLAMGDVMGHGLRAAAMMGRVRTALRAYAIGSSDPAAVLDSVDTFLHQFEGEDLVTVVYAVLSANHDTITMSSAGHMPPLVIHPSGDKTYLAPPLSPPLNVESGRRRDTLSLPFPVGATIILYTDGLIERREVDIDFGLERLRQAARGGPAQETSTRILLSLVGNRVLDDDFALLALHRTGPEEGTLRVGPAGLEPATDAL